MGYKPWLTSRACRSQVFSFPILHNTVWRLVVVAMAACALGRLHVPIAVWFTNTYRRARAARTTPLPNRELRTDLPLAELSGGVSLVLWWSGLRGGVAFALASSSFGRGDFVQHCGGLAAATHGLTAAHGVAGSSSAPGASAHSHGWARHCSEQGSHHSMTDGHAILQTTLIVATVSIFVLGGSVKRVAESCGVLKTAIVASERAAVGRVSRSGSRGRLLATFGS